MWIIFFGNVPSFWLLGGEVYRVGKKDCHIVIQDDRSISRTHLSIDIGESPLQSITAVVAPSERPAPLSLIDSSTYGTVVVPSVDPTTTSSIPAEEEEWAKDVGIPGVRCTRPGSRRIGEDFPSSNTSPAKRPRPTASPMPPEDDVAAVGEQHRLTKGTPYHVPVDALRWHRFTVILGNHGACLQFQWVPLTATVEDIDRDLRTKLEHALSRCGVQLLQPSDVPSSATQEDKQQQQQQQQQQTAAQCYARTNFLVTQSVQPSAAVVAMLCRGVPIVTPAFFAAFRDRATPQVPPPLPRLYAPPLSVFWRQLLQSTTNTTNMTAEDLLQPNPLRQRIFAGYTFVVFQRTLLEEVSQYVSCARGTVLWDDTLPGVVNGKTKAAVLSAFFTRHQRHVVLYNESERMPFQNCVATLEEQLGLVCVECAALVETVAFARPLALKAFPVHPPACFDEVPSGGLRAPRKSDQRPMFPEMQAVAQVEGRPSGEATRVVDPEGWVTRVDHGEVAEVASSAAAAVTEEEEEARALPSYPCFQPYDPSLGERPAGRFRKQQLLPAEAPVEMDRNVAVMTGAEQLLSRVPAIDAEDVIPEYVEAPGSRTGMNFNAFETAALDAMNKKKSNTKGRAKKNTKRAAPTGQGVTAATKPRGEAAATTITVPRTAERGRVSTEEDDVPEPAPQGGGGYFNIFDIDGIF